MNTMPKYKKKSFLIGFNILQKKRVKKKGVYYRLFLLKEYRYKKIQVELEI